MKHIEEIKTLLVNFVNFAHAHGLKGDSNWTNKIKELLIGLGEEHQYKTCTSGFRDECDPEWLFDLVWYKEDGTAENKRLTELPMVLECEWNLHQKFISYDFEKLLIANAPLKVMICQSKEEDKNDRLEYFRSAIVSYRQITEPCRYLIALLDYNSEEFHFEVM